MPADGFIVIMLIIAAWAWGLRQGYRAGRERALRAAILEIAEAMLAAVATRQGQPDREGHRQCP